jgi:ATP-dependent Clp protease protease subunit
MQLDRSSSSSSSSLAQPESSEKNGLGLVREHLFAARTVLIFGEVTTALAEAVSSQLLALAERGSEPIRVVIHSPGGHVESGDTIHDVIRFIQPSVRILGTGWVASAGALIFAAARRENRFALPNTRFLLHQPLGGVGGPASDVEIEARQILAMRERLNGIFARATGQSPERIARDTERNHWMNAEEARAYGLVGTIVEGADAFAMTSRQARFNPPDDG